MVDSLILYESTETSFSTNGLGSLSEATSCVVTEERNGSYELEMTYPITGKRFEDLQNRRIVFAKPNPYTQNQPFRIYNISKPMNGQIRVSAEHISYDLSGYPVSPFEADSLPHAFQKLKQNCPVSHPFTFHTTRTTEVPMSTAKPMSTRSLLGGVEGSVLDIYGGEYTFDRFEVHLENSRGQNRGVSIRYGKNLTDLVQEENNSKVFTAVYPYWYALEYEYDSEHPEAEPVEKETLIVLDEKIVNAEGTYDYQKVYPLDLSSEWEEPPDQNQLRSAAVSYMKNHNIGVPEVSLTVSFVDLSKTDEYKNYQALTEVRLCDTVNVEFPKLGVSATSKCIKTTFDVLADRYTSVELGDAKATLSSTIAGIGNEISSAVESTSEKFRVSLVDAERGLQSEIDMTAEQLRLAVEAEKQRAEGAESNITTSLTFAINNVVLSVEEERKRASGEEEKLRSSITLTSDSLTLAVQNEIKRATGEEEKLNSSITQTADSLTLAVQNEKTRAEGVEQALQTSITQTADAIETKVSVNDIGSYIRQNYDQVLIGFNNNSSIIQLSTSGISFYNGSISSENRRATMDGSGYRFYRDNNYLGYMGTNTKYNQPEIKGLGFYLDAPAHYITFSSRENPSDDYYTTFFTLSKANGMYTGDGIHMSKQTYFHNYRFYFGDEDDHAWLKYVYASELGKECIFAESDGIGGVTPFYCGSGIRVINMADFVCNLDMHGYSILHQSDIRLKENISPTEVSGLDVINQVELKQFDWASRDLGHVKIGMIAQQIMNIDPDLVGEGSNGLYGIKSEGFIPYLISAVQELYQLIQGEYQISLYQMDADTTYDNARNLYSESEIEETIEKDNLMGNVDTIYDIEPKPIHIQINQD